eukprot:m.156052 g.156052  ORF g.156052 m.156052 type:complete len:582 (-) comp30970_c0_seq2:15-1760(-)
MTSKPTRFINRSQTQTGATLLVEDVEDIDDAPVKKKTVCNFQTMREVLMFLVFGASGWWSANAISAEFPVFNDFVPEGKKFPTFVNFAYQIGNIFPILFKCATGFFKTEKARKKAVSIAVFVVLAVAIVLLAVASLFWERLITVEGTQYSGVLLFCSLLAGGVGATSNVTYWALATRYPTHCTKALSTGMTFGSLVLSGVILLQRAGDNPIFSARTFFFIAAGVQGLMLVATFPILLLSDGKAAKSNKDGDAGDDSDGGSDEDDGDFVEIDPLLKPSPRTIYEDEEPDEDDNLPASYGAINSSKGDSLPEFHRLRVKRVEKPWYIDKDGGLFCFLCFLIYGMTYCIPSLVPFMMDAYITPIYNATNGTNRTDFNVALPSTSFSFTSTSAMTSSTSHNNNLSSSSTSAVSTTHLLPSTTSSITTTSWVETTTTLPLPTPSLANATNSSLKDDIYRVAIVLQSVGDISGRIFTAFYTPTHKSSLVTLSMVVVFLFSILVAGTALDKSIGHILPGDLGYTIPVIILIYYFLRGYTVTSIYVWVKSNMTQVDAERLSSNLGLCGQLGALLGNMAMFGIIELYHNM